MPDLRLLRYFVAVAEELSFTKAAESLFVTAPTISGGVKTLEREFGLRLFQRSPRSVALTDAGRQLLPQARNVLAESHALTEMAAVLQGTVRITAGCISGLGGSLFHEAARNMSFGGPEIELDILVRDWTDPTAGLASKQSDVAILVGPTSMDNDLARLRLWDDELLAVVPAGHRLALRSEVSPKDLDEVGFAWCEAGDEKAHAFFRLDDYRGGSPVPAKVFETAQALLLGVRAGEGVICLPSSFIGQFGFADLALVQLRPSPVVHVDVACRRDTASDLIDSYMRNVRTLAAGAVSPVQDTA